MTTIAVENNKAWFMVKICLSLILLSLIFPAFQQNANATSNGQQLQFAQDAYTVNEDAGYISIPISRIGGNNGVVGVTYCTCADTADAPSDFEHSSGTMIFYNDEDESSKSFRIKIQDDDIREGTEQFFVRLITPTGGAIIGENKEVTVTIIDNDPKGKTPPNSPPTSLPTSPPTSPPNQVNTDPDYASSINAIANPSPEASVSSSPTEMPTSTPAASPTATPAPKVMEEEPAVLAVSGSVTNMPNTATPWYNYIVVGSLLVLLSGTMLYRRIAAFKRE